MPYDSISELPDSVQSALPKHAQEIYKEAFNNAWEEYEDEGKRREGSTREETAHSVAWAAVKQSYVKDEESGKWRRKAA